LNGTPWDASNDSREDVQAQHLIGVLAFELIQRGWRLQGTFDSSCRYMSGEPLDVQTLLFADLNQVAVL
jgi:hypothetical protein